MNADLSKTCTVITGAAGGIGAAIVRRRLERGGHVVAVGRDAGRLTSAYGTCDAVTRVACDLTTDDGFATLVTAIEELHVSVGGFVHAAGVDAAAPLGLIAPDDVARLVAVHAAFPVRFFGWLRRMGHHLPGTSCVLLSSLAPHEGAKGHVAYAAAKGAVEGLIRPAAAELVDRGIRLNAVVLGVVETEMSAAWLSKLSQEGLSRLRASYPLGFGRPEAVADAVEFFLSPQSSWITGQTLVCDGGHQIA